MQAKAAGDTYMKGVTFVMTDADHHEERWTNSLGPSAFIFKYTRKK